MDNLIRMVTTMNGMKKMKLSDLQHRPDDLVDWKTLDDFFNNDGPQTLSQALVLTNVIKETKLLDNPEVDNNVVTNYLSGMATDTRTLSNEFAVMKREYNENKKKYEGNYNENSHMFSLTIAFEMQSWLEHYETTVGQSFHDLVDYINSIVPDENKITVNK